MISIRDSENDNAVPPSIGMKTRTALGLQMTWANTVLRESHSALYCTEEPTQLSGLERVFYALYGIKNHGKIPLGLVEPLFLVPSKRWTGRTGFSPNSALRRSFAFPNSNF